MDFLTAAILSGAAWDGFKATGKITMDYMKEKLKEWLINEQDLKAIVETINEFPEIYKKNPKIIEGAIEEDERLMNILRNTKQSQNIHVDMKQSHLENSQVNTLGAGSTINNNTTNYNQQPKSEPTPKTRETLREEIKGLLAQNTEVFKMYGPTYENKIDLMSRKHEAWKSMAKEIVVPNNEKIVTLLSENQHLLTPEEKVDFVAFKLHAEGFKDNQYRGEKIAEYPQFPIRINNILS